MGACRTRALNDLMRAALTGNGPRLGKLGMGQAFRHAKFVQYSNEKLTMMTPYLNKSRGGDRVHVLTANSHEAIKTIQKSEKL
jgi:hypothetical protein